ncbi:MAG: hypothetical protein LBK67_09555 [Coriobacteriales bacterium]|jgi:hypothetical protein|nr:hypothetical protein [Coriobacteriales bacterium]
MADQKKDTASWGKPPDNTERQVRSERRHNLISNLMTVLLTGVIIAGGFLVPTLLYPYLDLYLNETIQIDRPSSGTVSDRAFKQPITLYPWNLYEEDRLRLLTTMERNLLEERGVPGFLVATLRDHGLEMKLDEESYRTQIIISFRFLDPQDSAEQGCFVLIDADVDADERADLRCAVNLDGDIISLLFSSRQWDTVQIEAPIGMPITTPGDEQTPAEGEATGENPATIGTEGNEGAGTDTNAGGTTSTGTEGKEDTDDSKDTTTTDAGTPETDETPTPAIVEHLPVEEDQYLWSFAYATSREANMIGQRELFSAFRQLELIYEYRYGYPFTAQLPVRPTEPEELPEIDYISLTPTPFATEEYLLYIYDLPNGERLVLYLNPTSLRCMGFDLLQY